MKLGVYAGSPNGVHSFEQWLGQQAGLAHAFAGHLLWSDIEIPTSWASWWGSSPYRDRMLVSLPMLPFNDGEVSLAAGAVGAYDRHFSTAGQRLVAAGLINPIIRIGWELNGKWFPWAAYRDPASYRAFFRQIVKLLRQVHGQQFRIGWCVSVGWFGWDATKAYPGNDVVDYVLIDGYDQWPGHAGVSPQLRWLHLVNAYKQSGFDFWAAFARQCGKPVGLAEYGLWGIGDSHGGGGDDPYYIRQIHDWSIRNNVALHCYQNSDGDGIHRLDHFPDAAAEYQQLWTPAA